MFTLNHRRCMVRFILIRYQIFRFKETTRHGCSHWGSPFNHRRQGTRDHSRTAGRSAQMRWIYCCGMRRLCWTWLPFVIFRSLTNPWLSKAWDDRRKYCRNRPRQVRCYTIFILSIRLTYLKTSTLWASRRHFRSEWHTSPWRSRNWCLGRSSWPDSSVEQCSALHRCECMWKGAPFNTPRIFDWEFEVERLFETSVPPDTKGKWMNWLTPFQIAIIQIMAQVRPPFQVRSVESLTHARLAGMSSGSCAWHRWCNVFQLCSRRVGNLGDRRQTLGPPSFTHKGSSHLPDAVFTRVSTRESVSKVIFILQCHAFYARMHGIRLVRSSC